MNIFLSIIIPCFNCGKLMSRCIESLQRQTCQDFEVIFVDDYSTDDTCLFLQNFIDSNSILASLINAPYNGGPGKARELGVKEAKGKYVAFLDSDDWYRDDFVEAIKKRMESDMLDLLFFDYNRCYESGKTFHISSIPFYSDGFVKSDFMALTGDSVCGICIKANIIKKIKMPCFYNSEDAAVVPLLVYESKSIPYLPEAFYNYFARSNSLSTSVNPNIYKGFLQASNYIRQNIPDTLIREKEFRCINLVLYGAVFRALFSGVDKRIVLRFIDDFEVLYPNWRHNKYYCHFPFRKRVFLALVRNRSFLLIKSFIKTQKIVLSFR